LLYTPRKNVPENSRPSRSLVTRGGGGRSETSSSMELAVLGPHSTATDWVCGAARERKTVVSCTKASSYKPAADRRSGAAKLAVPQHIRRGKGRQAEKFILYEEELGLTKTRAQGNGQRELY